MYFLNALDRRVDNTDQRLTQDVDNFTVTGGQLLFGNYNTQASIGYVLASVITATYNVAPKVGPVPLLWITLCVAHRTPTARMCLCAVAHLHRRATTAPPPAHPLQVCRCMHDRHDPGGDPCRAGHIPREPVPRLLPVHSRAHQGVRGSHCVLRWAGTRATSSRCAGLRVVHEAVAAQLWRGPPAQVSARRVPHRH